MLLQEAVGLYIQYNIMLQRSNETIKSYRYALNGFNRFLIRENNCPVYIDEISEGDIEKYLLYLVREKAYSSKSRQSIVNVVRSFGQYCKVKGILKYNLAECIQSIKADRKERHYLTETEIQNLVDATNNALMKVIIQMLYYTGLRISELIKLSLTDVDLQGGMIYVKGGKGNKDRNVPINEKLKTILKDYLANIRGINDSGIFFCTRSGAVSKSYITKLFQRVREECGIRNDITFHIMRHSFSSNLLKKGVDIATVQRLLGHSSIKTTGIYLHSNYEDLIKAVNKL